MRRTSTYFHGFTLNKNAQGNFNLKLFTLRSDQPTLCVLIIWLHKQMLHEKGLNFLQLQYCTKADKIP